MLGIGPFELLAILVVLIFLDGGKRLPGIGEGLGKGISGIKKALGQSASPSLAERQKRLRMEKEQTEGARGTHPFPPVE